MATDEDGDDAITEFGRPDVPGDVGLVAPRWSVFEDTITTVVPATDASFRVLAPDHVVARASRGLGLACWIAEYMDRDRLAVGRIDRSAIESAVAVTPEAVYSLVGRTDGAGYDLRTLERDSADPIRETFEDGWQEASGYTPRVSAYSDLVDSIDDRLGGELASDVEMLLGPTPADATGYRDLDAVTALLLLAASHEAQLYHVSRWADANGVASIATCSNRKRTLEDAGFLDSEPVNSGRPGRPRLRLHLADDSLIDLDVETLLDTAVSRLAAVEA